MRPTIRERVSVVQSSVLVGPSGVERIIWVVWPMFGSWWWFCPRLFVREPITPRTVTVRGRVRRMWCRRDKVLLDRCHAGRSFLASLLDRRGARMPITVDPMLNGISFPSMPVFLRVST